MHKIVDFEGEKLTLNMTHTIASMCRCFLRWKRGWGMGDGCDTVKTALPTIQSPSSASRGLHRNARRRYWSWRPNMATFLAILFRLAPHQVASPSSTSTSCRCPLLAPAADLACKGLWMWRGGESPSSLLRALRLVITTIPKRNPAHTKAAEMNISTVTLTPASTTSCGRVG